MNAAASEARNTAASAASSGAPWRRNGVAPATAVRTSGLVNSSWKRVAIMPQHSAFTRIPFGPSSLAMARVKVITAALAVA